MKIENIVEPAARLERKVLETRCILVQILEVLKSRHRLEEAGEKENNDSNFSARNQTHRISMPR